MTENSWSFDRTPNANNDSTPSTNTVSSTSHGVSALTGKLAAKFELPHERLLACIQRLVASAPRHGHPQQELSHGLFRDGCPELLRGSLARMPADVALTFVESEDLHAYPRRSAMAQYFASGKTPLLSLTELRQLLSEFVAHQHQNEDTLVATGHPTTHFGRSTWLDVRLNKLYFTKIPTHLRTKTACGGGSCLRRSYPRSYLNWQRIGTRAKNAFMPDGFEVMGHSTFFRTEEAPALTSSWVKQSEEDTFSICTYEEADLLAGLSTADSSRLSGLRARLLKVKTRLLDELVTVIRENDRRNVWERSLAILAGELLADEAEFLLGMDQFFAGYSVRQGESETKLLPLCPGGLTDLFELIGYVEKELAIGTLDRTRGALGDALVLDHLQRPRLLTDLNRSSWPRLKQLAPSNPYLDLIAVGKGEQIRDAVDEFSRLDSEEPAFWRKFRDRAEKALSSEFNAVVGIQIKQQFRLVLAPLLQQFADDWCGGEGRYRVELALSNMKSGKELEESQGVFERTGESWNIQYQNGPLFPMRQLVGLTYLHVLISNPEKPFRPSELQAHVVRAGTSKSLTRYAEIDPGTELADVCSCEQNGGGLIDKRALREVKGRSEEIIAEIEGAERNNDLGRVVKLKLEQGQLDDYLKSATRPGGQIKQAMDRSKRERDAVTKAIKTALRKLSQKDSLLGEHFCKCLLMKGFYRYSPGSGQQWRT